jgi:DnaJ-class molecular chaperone
VPTHAATATATPTFAALIILTLIVLTLGYTLACWLYPFTTCRRCHGTGKRRAILGGRTFGHCRRCHGDGHTIRPGRRVLNYLRVLHDKGTRR